MFGLEACGGDDEDATEKERIEESTETPEETDVEDASPKEEIEVPEEKAEDSTPKKRDRKKFKDC